MKKTYKIEVDCANCANKMEDATKKTPGVRDASVNFMTLKMKVEFGEGSDPQEVMERVRGNCKGEEKVKRIQNWLASKNIQPDYAASFAYGDSKSDLPMLRLVGHPVQVNPKKKLKKAAPDMDTVSWD